MTHRTIDDMIKTLKEISAYSRRTGHPIEDWRCDEINDIIAFLYSKKGEATKDVLEPVPYWKDSYGRKPSVKLRSYAKALYNGENMQPSAIAVVAEALAVLLEEKGK